MQLDPNADFSGRLIAFGVQQTSIQTIYCSSLKKREIADNLSKQMLQMIRLFIWIKKGNMLIFKYCLNVIIMGDLLKFMV